MSFLKNANITYYHIFGIKALHIPLLWKILVIATLGALYFFCAKLSINIPTEHLDGAFQTASGLYRLAGGQHPGKDFFPYLGIGPLYLLYPAFTLAGADLAASVFAARLNSLITFTVSISVIAFLVTRSRSYLFALSCGMIFLLLAMVLSEDLPAILHERTIPGNSLRPLRGFLPYLDVIFIYIIIRRASFTPHARYAALGIVGGLNLLWSNDYGITSLLMLSCFSFGFMLQQKQFSLANICILIGTMFISATGSLLLVTHGHIISLLHYNFINVAGDQWWYYWYWVGDRIFVFSDLITIFKEGMIFGCIVFVILLLLFLRRPCLDYALLVYLGVSLFLGGLLPSIGGQLVSYFCAFLFWATITFSFCIYQFSRSYAHYLHQATPAEYGWWCGLVFLIVVDIFATFFDAPAIINVVRQYSTIEDSFIGIAFWLAIITCSAYTLWTLFLLPSAFKERVVLWCSIILPVALVCCALLTAYHQAQLYYHAKAEAEHDKSHFYVPELGGYLPNAWNDYINEARKAQGTPFIEEYWGIWGAMQHQLMHPPVDSVIHALGTTRELFRHDMMQLPEIVITSKMSHSILQSWSVSINWWFYQPLLKNYYPATVAVNTIIWKKKKQLPWISVPCTVTNNPVTQITLGASAAGYYEVMVNYHLESSRIRNIVLVKNNINGSSYNSGNYLSLNPKAKQALFPVYIRYKNEPLDFLVAPDNHYSELKLTHCSAQKITFGHPEVLEFSQ